MYLLQPLIPVQIICPNARASLHKPFCQLVIHQALFFFTSCAYTVPDEQVYVTRKYLHCFRQQKSISKTFLLVMARNSPFTLVLSELGMADTCRYLYAFISL